MGHQQSSRQSVGKAAYVVFIARNAKKYNKFKTHVGLVGVISLSLPFGRTLRRSAPFLAYSMTTTFACPSKIIFIFFEARQL
jgi:hypothetical protein